MKGRYKRSVNPPVDQLPLWYQALGDDLVKKGCCYFQVDFLSETGVREFFKLFEVEGHLDGVATKSILLMNKDRDNQNIYSLFLCFGRRSRRGKALSIFSTMFPTAQAKTSKAASECNIRPLSFKEWAEAKAKTKDLVNQIETGEHDSEEDRLFLAKCSNFNSEFQVLLQEVNLRYSQKIIELRAYRADETENDELLLQQQDEEELFIDNSPQSELDKTILNQKRQALNSTERVALQVDAEHKIEKRRKINSTKQQIKVSKKNMDSFPLSTAFRRSSLISDGDYSGCEVSDAEKLRKIEENIEVRIKEQVKAQYVDERETTQKAIMELQTRVSNQEKTVVELKGQLNELIQERESSEPQNQIDQLNVKFRQQTESLESRKNKIIEDMKDMKNTMMAMGDINQKYKDDLENKTNKIANLTDELQKEKEKSSLEIKRLNDLLMGLSSHLSGQKKEMENSFEKQLEEKDEEYKRRMDEAEKKNNELQEQLAKERAENNLLRKQGQLCSQCQRKLLASSHTTKGGTVPAETTISKKI